MRRNRLMGAARTLAGAALVVGMVIGPHPATAAAPPPPLDACLGQAPVDLGSLDCELWHDTLGGDRFGVIDSVVQHVLQTGEQLTVGFAPAGEYFFDHPIVCGTGGCVSHSIAWRPTRGFSMDRMDGCGGTDLTCTFKVWPDGIVGDAAERWQVLYVQHYRGVVPQNGVAHAVFIAPRFYPVQVDPVTTTGAPATPSPQDVAYAVRAGADVAASSCVQYSWWISLRYQPTFSVPDCIALRQNGDSSKGTSMFEGVLPVDSGDWSIVAAPAGTVGAALTSRPTPYRPLSVRPVGDDIRTRIVEAPRPQPIVTIEPETSKMDLGGAQDVRVAVTAANGEAGDLTLSFATPDVLTVRGSDPAALELEAASDALPAGPFTLVPGAQQTFIVRLDGIAEGRGVVTAAVEGVNDLGQPVSADAASTISVALAGQGSGAESLPPPVVEYAAVAAPSTTASSTGGHVEGTVTGAPGGIVRVAIWTSPAVDDRCSQQVSGPDVMYVGSADVTLGDDGSGPFSFDAALTEGWFTYGVSAVGPQASGVGQCRGVAADMPTISVSDAGVVEGTAKDGTTTLDAALTLSQPSDVPVSVQLSTRDGTATSANDYGAITGEEVTFAPGQTTAQVHLDVVPDALVEDDETLRLVLSSPRNGRLPAPGAPTTSESVMTITDDDDPGRSDVVGDSPDIRGTWTFVRKKKVDGKVIQTIYTMTVVSQDPVTGAVKGRWVVDPWQDAPTERGSVRGTVAGDTFRFTTTGTHFFDYSDKVTLMTRKGKLTMREKDGSTTFTLTDPR